MIPARQYTSGSEIIAARAELRKRLFSPQRAPVKRAEPVEAVVTRVYLTAPVERVWTVQHDWHVRAYIEWKGNEPLGYLKMRCREMDLAFEEIASKGCRKKIIVRPRQTLMCEVKTTYPHLTLPAIGRLFGGFDHTTVIHSLRKGGMDAAEFAKIKRNADLEAGKILVMLRAGKSQEEIAQAIGFSQTAVSKVIRNKGWGRFSRCRRIANHQEQVKALFDDGASFAQISRVTGFTPNNVSHFIKRKGWTR